MDGKLENALTGAGVRGVDAGSSTERRLLRYSPAQGRLEYRQSWAARREIDRPARDLVAGGFELQDLPPGFDGPAIVSACSDIGLAAVPEDRGVLAALSRLHAEGNKGAGAALVVVLDDGLDPWMPVDLARIKRVVSLELLERDEITPWRGDSAIGGPVEYYIIGTSRTVLTASSIVHSSRVILNKGARLSPSEEWANQGWGASTLEILHTERQSMHVAHQEMGTLILRANQDVVYLGELSEMLCDEENPGRTPGDIDARLALMSRNRGQHRLIPLDAGRSALAQEEAARPSDRFERIGAPAEGIAKLAVAVENGWAAGTGQTPSIALGRNVGGLNTGANAGDWQSWSSKNDGEREDWLYPRLDYLIELVCASKEGPTGGRIPETWCVKMRPLWVPPEKEVAEIRKLQAEGDEIAQRTANIPSEMIYEQRHVLGATGELRLEPLPVLEVDPLAVGGADDASKQALNGAQIQALFELSANVSAAVIPIETALWLVGLAVPGIDETAARAALTAAASVDTAALSSAIEPVAVVPAEVADAAARAFVAKRDAGRKWWRRDAKPTEMQALDSWRRAWCGNA